ncbi:MAG: antitoxin family protein [Blastocatellia bacterium]
MTIAVEAIYEAGVLKPVRPLNELKDKDKVFLKLETVRTLDELLANPIQIDPQIAREISENSMWDTTEEMECESIVERQRRERLILEPAVIADLMNNREHDLFEA